MAVRKHEFQIPGSFGGRLRDSVGFFGLFGALAAYTLTTLDGGDIAPRIISSAMLLVSAFYFAVPLPRGLTISVPAVCLLLMTAYGAAQAIWSTQKIAYNGWSSVIFWFTAATICLVSMRVFRDRRTAARFRLLFVTFGSVICVLDLLQEASHTNRYFWLIQSRYTTVNGSFAYWNNFAQFVELFLPITLWLGVRGRRPAVGYLILSGLQIGAVVASGSRAGSALVMAELITVMLMAYFRNRNKVFLYAAAGAIFVSALFAYAAGFDTLNRKLQQRDQLAVRRDINSSSLAMIHRRPFTGWGLGTYVPVYRMFARYDDGTYVNRAHNDWLEWTAEGGILFSSLMAVAFFWSIRPAIRSIWGVGVIAICLHAIVDYPFARFGVCGWYFALLGMLAINYRSEALQRKPNTYTSASRFVRRRSVPSGS